MDDKFKSHDLVSAKTIHPEAADDKVIYGLFYKIIEPPRQINTEMKDACMTSNARILSAGLSRVLTMTTALFLAAVLSASSAGAQNTPESLPLPSTISLIDENSVDIIGGTFHSKGAQHTIGSADSGMALSRTKKSNYNDYMHFLVDDYSGAINLQSFPGYVSQPDQAHTDVTFGYSTYRFQLVNDIYQPYKQSKGDFSCSGTTCFLVLPDGTTVEYDTQLLSQLAGFEARGGQVKKVVKPSGEILTYTYNSQGSRLSVSSSLGWMLKRSLSQPAIPQYKLINTGSHYCDPNAENCDALTAYPVVTDSVDAGGATWQTIYGAPISSNGYQFDVLNTTSPRGVVASATSWQGHNANGPLPAHSANRVASLKRGDSSWGYVTYYDVANQPWSALALWWTDVYQPSGSAKRYLYWPEGSRVVQYIDELGRKTSFSGYNLGGDPTVIVQPDATFQNSNTDPIKGGIATGGYSTYDYDSRRNLTRVANVPKNAGSDHSRDIVWTAIFSSTCEQPKVCNKPESITDPSNATTEFLYDTSHGGVLTETYSAVNGVRKQTRYSYQQFTPYVRNSSGGVEAQPLVWRLVTTKTCRTMTLATCAGKADELTTTITYGTNNVLPVAKTVSRGDGSGATTTGYTYDLYGNVTVEDGPKSGLYDATYFFYDSRRLKIGIIGPDPDGAGSLPRAATRTAYGTDGQVETTAWGVVSDVTIDALLAMTPQKRTEIGYSTTHGFPIAERTYGTGSQPELLRQTSYDARLRRECTALRMNKAAFGAALPNACDLGTEGSDGPDRIDRTEYDTTSAVLSVTNGYRTSLARAERINNYDPATGRLAWMDDANGNRSSYEYDDYGRLSRWLFPVSGTVGAHASNANDYEEYGYDGRGLRTSYRKRDGRVLGYQYDALGRLWFKSVPDGCAPIQLGPCPSAPATRDVYYGYDLLGLPTYARFDSSSGDGVTFDNDVLGWQRSSTITMGSVSRKLDYQHDDLGNRTRITHPDSVFFAMRYDNLNRMDYANWNDTTPFLSIAYDALGRRDDITRGGSYTGYDYDGVSRLISQDQRFVGGTGNTTTAFGYNPAGQITSRTLSNADYAYTGYVAKNLSYTTNGLNQYSSVQSSMGQGPNAYQYDANGNLISDGGKSYGYDAENRLVSASGEVALSYDPLGRLWQTAGGTPVTTQFLYDGDALVAEYNGSGTLLRRYMHGPGVDEPILWAEGSALSCSNTKFLHTDHQGSVVALADCSGNRAAVYAYDEYGVPNASYSGRFQYTGQAWIPELNIYYYKARMYSPMLGRFFQNDPIGYEDQVNLYAYVANDPVNGRDPTGNQTLPADMAAQVQALRQSGKSDAEIRSILSQQAESDRGASSIVLSATLAVVPIERVFSGLSKLAEAIGLGRLGVRSAVATEVTVAGSKNLLGQVTENLAAKGFDAPKIQEVMGWGSRASGASARLESMNGANAAAQVREAGMTKGMVQSLREGYADAAARGRGVGVAPLRVEILDKIIKKW